MRLKWLRFWAARDGLGAIEFAFVAPVLAAMLLGILDFGMAYWEKMEVANAADAGAQWGMTNTYNQSSITTVATSATNLPLPSSNVSPSNPCGCASESGVAIYACAATCPDGSTPKSYVVVNTHICYSTIFRWPGLTYCSAGDSNCTGCSTRQISLTAQSIMLK
jgi:Flp pilus assembly protein TadG